MANIENSPIKDIESALNASDELAYEVRRLVNNLLGSLPEEGQSASANPEGSLNRLAGQAAWSRSLARMASHDLARLRDAFASHQDGSDISGISVPIASPSTTYGRLRT